MHGAHQHGRVARAVAAVPCLLDFLKVLLGVSAAVTSVYFCQSSGRRGEKGAISRGGGGAKNFAHSLY